LRGTQYPIIPFIGYEKRAIVKDTKVRLGIQTDDADLINQKVGDFQHDDLIFADIPKPQKRRQSEYPVGVRPSGTQIRLPGRPDGRSFDADLKLLSDIIEDKENALKREIEEKSHQHRKWNESHVDLTREPLSPVQSPGPELAFRPATAQYHYLMTPPSSVTSDSIEQAAHAQDKVEPFSFRYSSPMEEDEPIGQPAYRRRIGRGGRLWIDRRGLPPVGRIFDDSPVSDRWKYDQDDDEEQPIYEKDPYGFAALRFRSTIPFPSHLFPQRRGHDAAALNGANNRAIAAAPQPQPPAPT